MTSEKSISLAVDFYRSLGKPPVKDGRFTVELPYTREYADLIDKYRKESWIEIDDLFINDKICFNNDPIPQTGSKIELTLKIPANEGNTFHGSLSAMLKIVASIGRGEIPEDFYIVDIDYYSLQDKAPEKIETLYVFCRMIRRLSHLSHFHDAKVGSDNCRFVFVQPEETKQSGPVVIETKITEDMLSSTPPDISLLDELCEGSQQDDPHHSSKVSVFRTSLIDFINKKTSKDAAFEHLVENWPSFIEDYHRNIGTYLSGFAFHKARKEVAETELSIADHFSKVISEIAGKLLGIPLSMAAVVPLLKSGSMIESILIMIGLILASLVLSGAVANQQSQLRRISDAKQIMFEAIEGKKESYPETLKNSVDNMIKELNTNEKKLGRFLWIYRTLSWLPTLAGLIVFIYLYPKNFFSFIKSIFILFS